MCKLRGELAQLGCGFPPYRNYQLGEGIFPRYILPSNPATQPITEDSKSLAKILKQSLAKRVTKRRRRKPTKKIQIQSGAGKKRRRRRKAKGKPKRKRSKKRQAQIGGVRSLKNKKKKPARKGVYKKGKKAVTLPNFNF